MATLNAGGSLLAGIVAAIGASLCCVAPLVLLGLGVGGAWISNLTALEPYRPMFTGLTLLFLGIAWRRLYLAPRACAAAGSCADTKTLRRRRTVFWFVSAHLLVLLSVPWVVPLFY